MFRSRRLVVFVGVALAGALLQGFSGPGGMAQFLNMSAASYFATVFVLAAVAALFTPPARDGLDDGDELEDNWLGGAPEFLCDTCRYNDARDCHRPERPNATVCDDYSRC